MNKFRAEVNRETNYVYHMLSVAQCGYDNDYGRRYASLHRRDDLAVLKGYERLLTVAGGEHCGELYGPLIAWPATGDERADDFYRRLITEPPKGYERETAEIAGVMLRGYDVYIQRVWPEDQAVLLDYAARIQRRFEEADFTARAEELVGIELPTAFRAMLCNSLAYGAEAIDISEDQDVFGIDRSEEHALLFMGHEFIIYLLKRALRDTDAFMRMETWTLTEGLAEFYLKRLMGSSGFFNDCARQMALYEALHSAHPDWEAKALYSAAVKAASTYNGLSSTENRGR